MAGTSRCRACGTPIRHEQTPLGLVVLLESQPHPDGERYLRYGLAVSAANLRLEVRPAERFREHPRRCKVVEFEHGGEG
jgi:hypothetical protein